MKKNKLMLEIIISLILLLNVSGLAFGQEVPAYYKLGSGDAVRITVLGYSVLDDTVTVDEDGYIPFQLIGKVKAAGLTAAELEDTLVKELSAYLEEPKVKATIVSATHLMREFRKEEEVPLRPSPPAEEIFGKKVSAAYRLGVGDILKIEVVGHPSMSEIVDIDSEGMISFELVERKIEAAGLTSDELASELSSNLERYIQRPRVNVLVSPRLITGGDLLDISISGYPKIGGRTRVRFDGNLSFPLIEPIKVEGMNREELSDLLAGKLMSELGAIEVRIEYIPYLLETGDVLSISVWDHPDLDDRVVIDLVGNISYPYLGELRAAGLTKQELAEHIAGDLARYLKEPRVNVSRLDQKLNSGDELQIAVWGYPDYSRQTTISPTGYISLPTLGEVKAEGLTRHELATKLSQKLGQYVPDPKVNIKVVNYKNKKGGEPSPYLIDVEDKVRVILWKPEGAEEHIRDVDPSGNLSLPLIGEVKAKGLSEPQLAERLKEKWVKYLIDPKVAVDVVDYKSRFVYVFGEVRKPGKFPMKGNIITLREVLIEAGLPIQGIASMRNVRVIRPAYSQASIKLADTVKLLREGELRENFELYPGDMVYVPPTFLTKVSRFMQLILLPLSPAAQIMGIFNVGQ